MYDFRVSFESEQRHNFGFRQLDSWIFRHYVLNELVFDFDFFIWKDVEEEF